MAVQPSGSTISRTSVLFWRLVLSKLVTLPEYVTTSQSLLSTDELIESPVIVGAVIVTPVVCFMAIWLSFIRYLTVHWPTLPMLPS